MSREQVLRTCIRRSSLLVYGLPRCGLDHLARPQAPGTGVDATGGAADRAHRLQVQVPFPARDVVSVADVAPRHGGLSAEVAMLGHLGPLSSAFALRKSAASYNAGFD